MARKKIIERWVGDKRYWLTRRPGRKVWYITWNNEQKGRTDRVTTNTEQLDKAEIKLDEHIYSLKNPHDTEIEEMPIAIVIDKYLDHVAPIDGEAKIRSSYQARHEATFWANFFTTETIDTLTLTRQEEFHKWLFDKGYSKGYVSRILSTGRAAFNRAWKTGMLKSTPFIADVVSMADRRKAKPKGKPLKFEEVCALFDNAKTPHAWAFLIGSIATMSRPEAVMELETSMPDWDYHLLDTNPEGREQTKKFRPIVPISKTLEPWLRRNQTHLVMYHGKPVKSVKTLWRNLREAAELDKSVNPYSLRHTMGRYLRSQGEPDKPRKPRPEHLIVDSEQITLMLGHKPRTATEVDLVYSPYSPDYCATAVEAIDYYLDRVAQAIGRQLIPENAPLILPPHMTKKNKEGSTQCHISATNNGKVVSMKSKKAENPLVSQEVSVVGGTGIEPVTPTMSTANSKAKSVTNHRHKQ